MLNEYKESLRKVIDYTLHNEGLNFHEWMMDSLDGEGEEALGAEYDKLTQSTDYALTLEGLDKNPKLKELAQHHVYYHALVALEAFG